MVKTVIEKSRIVICVIDELPSIVSPGCDLMIIDDAHLLSESQVFLGLRHSPKRLILSGTHFTSFGDSQKTHRTLNQASSMFKRLIVQNGFVQDLKSQHRAGGILKKLNETIFSVQMGREGCF